MNAKEKEEKLAILKEKLATSEKGLENNTIKNNPVLIKSLKAKVQFWKAQVNALSAEVATATTPKEAVKAVTKVESKKATEKSVKPKATKKAKVEKTAKVAMTSGKFKEGDEVSFTLRGTDKKETGKITRIYKSYHSDKHIAVVQCKDRKREVYITKLEAVK
jgi:hypothetical protein